MVFAVHHRDAVGADGSGREVNHADAGLERAQEGIVLDVGAGAGGVEHEVDVFEHIQAREAFHALVRGGHTHTGGAGQAIRRWVDADHGAHFDVLAVAQDLDHQVGADVAAADDGGLEFAGHGHSFAKTAVTEPSPAMRTSKTSPPATGTIGPSAPESTVSPARRGRPARAMTLASQSIALSGEPSRPNPRRKTPARLAAPSPCLPDAHRNRTAALAWNPVRTGPTRRYRQWCR